MSWEDKLDKELRFHMEQAVQDYIAQGMTEREARERARRDFGSVALAKEEIRDTRSLRWLADFVQDVRYALRGFRQRPGFAATAILVLALGIGANTAVFSLLHRVLLASLPVENPDELVEVSCTNPFDTEDVGCGSSYPGFKLFAERSDLFAGIFAFSDFLTVNVVRDGAGEVANGVFASGSFFSTLGVSPAAGRLFNPSDDEPASAPVAVLSYAYWQRRFGADPTILGKTYAVNGIPVTFIGVTPPSFRNVTLDVTPDLTFPLQSMTDRLRYPGALQERGDWWLRIIARRRPNVGSGQIQAALEPVFTRTVEDMIDALGTSVPANLGVTFRSMRLVILPASTGASSEMRRDLDRPLRILMSAVAMVLLIACANLGGLLLARSAARRREFGVRLALGAGRARLFRQLLTESLLLALIGAAAGILTSTWTEKTLLYLAAGENGSRALDSGLDASVLAFTMGVSGLAALIIGIVPALRLSSLDPHSAVRETPGAGPRSRFATTLIPAQVGLTVVLLIGAVLFLRTFENFRHVDLGYQAEELLSFRVNPNLVKYDAANSRAFFTAMRAKLESLPGVRAITLSHAPVGDISNRTVAAIPGFETRNFNDWMISRNFIGARFAETTGLRLLHGRDFTAADLTASQLPAIVNESFARYYFGSAEAIGKRFNIQKDTFTVAGVVADAHDRGPKTKPERTAYVPLPQGTSQAFVTVRSRTSPDSMIPAVLATLREIDATVPVDRTETAQAFVEGQLSRERLLASLSGAFGFLALLLVGIGLYGLIAGAVAARTRELGIRVALGAKPSSVAWLVTRESVRLVAIGAGLGLAAGAYLARFVESQLFGVTPGDPWAYAAATLALIGAGAVAAYLPARRATRIDPMTALRCD